MRTPSYTPFVVRNYWCSQRTIAATNPIKHVDISEIQMQIYFTSLVIKLILRKCDI